MAKVIEGYESSLYTMSSRRETAPVVVCEGTTRQWSGAGPISPFEATEEELRRHYSYSTSVEQVNAQHGTQQAVGREVWDAAALMATLGTTDDTSPDGHPLPY